MADKKKKAKNANNNCPECRSSKVSRNFGYVKCHSCGYCEGGKNFEQAKIVSENLKKAFSVMYGPEEP